MSTVWRRGYFTSHPLRVEWLESGQLRLTHILVYWARDGRIFRVPEGTTTDLASVPPLFRSATAVLGAGWAETARAGVLHDWLYSIGQTSRRDADRLFRQALRSEGVGPFAAWVMWASVRVGGWRAWNKWRQRGKEADRRGRSTG